MTRNNIRVADAEAAIVSGESPPGGFKKTYRTKRLEERPGKNKTSRRLPKHQLLPFTESKEEPTAKPSGIKSGEENMKDTTNRVVPKPKLGFEICPMCGFFSKVTPRDGKKPYWVCKGCDDDYQTYIKEVEMKIKTGEIPKIIWTKSEWLLIHLDPSSIEKELIEAREKRDHLKERVAQKIRTETGGKDIDKRLVSALAERYEKEMSTDDYNLIRWLYGWLKATLQLKAELENKIAAEKAAKTALTVVPITEPTAPVPAAVNS